MAVKIRPPLEMRSQKTDKVECEHGGSYIRCRIRFKDRPVEERGEFDKVTIYDNFDECEAGTRKGVVGEKERFLTCH